MTAKPLKEAFSLIEVLVFISIMSLFFVIAVSVTSTSVKYMSYNEHKILATKHAEDLIEWLRGVKDENWNTFVQRAGTTLVPKSYCFNDKLSAFGTFPSAPCGVNDYSGIVGLQPPIFKREAQLIVNGTGQVRVEVSVKWKEGATEYQVPLNTVFSIWE